MDSSLRGSLTGRMSALASTALVIAITATGCVEKPAERIAAPSASATPTAPSEALTAPPPTQTGAAMSAATPIVIEIDGQDIVGQLDASATAASLRAQLPLTLSFRDFGGQEKIARLPEALDLTDAPRESGAEPLTIGYYAPDQSIVFYYDRVGIYPGIVPIGHYVDTDVIETRAGEFSMTIRDAG